MCDTELRIIYSIKSQLLSVCLAVCPLLRKLNGMLNPNSHVQICLYLFSMALIRKVNKFHKT